MRFFLLLPPPHLFFSLLCSVCRLTSEFDSVRLSRPWKRGGVVKIQLLLSSSTQWLWKQESHGGEVTDAHEPTKGRLLSWLSILEVLSQGCLTWAEGHQAGREVSHPGFSKEGCHSSRCPGTLTGILATTWEVSIMKRRNRCGQRIFSLIPLAAPGFLSAYGTLGFF